MRWHFNIILLSVSTSAILAALPITFQHLNPDQGRTFRCHSGLLEVTGSGATGRSTLWRIYGVR